MSTTLLVLWCVFAFALGYWLWGNVSSPIKRRIFMRRAKCFFGQHAVGPIKDTHAGVVQRCDYCDRIVHMFEKDKDGYIRRVQ